MRPLLIAGLGVAAAAALVITVMASDGPTGGASSPSAAHLGPAACAAQEPNASIEEIIVHLYEGNGNASGPGSGLIDQGPPGPSAYPSEAAALANLIAGWQAVCESAAYYDLIQEWGAPTYPINALAQNGTGVYEAVVGVTWQAPSSFCSSVSSGSCVGSAQWLVNVASGSVTGPTTSYYSPQPAG